MFNGNTRYPVKVLFAVFLTVFGTEIARQNAFGGLFLFIHSILMLLIHFLAGSRQKDREVVFADHMQQFIDSSES